MRFKKCTINQILPTVLLLGMLSACSHTVIQERPTETPDHSNTTSFSIPLKPPVSLRGVRLPENKANNLWDRVRSGFAIPDHQHVYIENELAQYRRQPDYLERVCERAKPFLFNIIEAIDRSNLPTELALLPIVESAYQTYAYSPRHASGLWQFVPATGKQFGLAQNWWYDGRRDPYAATEAAVKYLQYLNTMFDSDWWHTLAAYNAGPTTIRKAILKNKRRNLPTDYWSLSLPRETRHYIPKILALRRLIDHPDKYGLALCDIPDSATTTRVQLNGRLDFTVAAHLAEIDLETLYQLNSGFNRWSTPPEGPHHLILPTEKVRQFTEREKALPAQKRLRLSVHQVKPGETLSHIAIQYGTTVAAIKQTNHLTSTQIKIGQRLFIANRHQTNVALSKIGNPAVFPNIKRKLYYRIKKGDSLYKIAEKFNTRVDHLLNWNRLNPDKHLQPGQQLVIYINVLEQTSVKE